MTVPQVSAPSSTTLEVQLGLSPTSATLPVVSQITGTLVFPAVHAAATISLSASASAPSGVGIQSVKRVQSGTLTVYEYVTIVSPITLTLPSIPAFTLCFPASTPLAGKNVYYGISDINARGGQVSFDTQGPGTISGQTVAFAQVPTSIVFAAGHKYTFVVYSTTTAVGATKIYVASNGTDSNGDPAGTVTTYDADGTQTTPTIAPGSPFEPWGVAVDAAGKIYVADYFGSTSEMTFEPDGSPTTPTISLAQGGGPWGIGVDTTGKIYTTVGFTTVDRPGGVTFYSFININNADGSYAGTISAGLENPEAVAIDAAGKIYVANSTFFRGDGTGNVTTYKPDGTQTTPTITADVSYPSGIAVDAAGKIYVANGGSVTTYKPDGTQTTPTITDGLNGARGVAVDAAGKIYVVNYGGNNVTTYNPNGTRATPTIAISTSSTPTSIAVH